MSDPRVEAFTPGSRPPIQLGPYKVDGVLGRGGMGIVYAVHREGSDETLACKVLVAGADVPHKIFERFAREGQALTALDAHPNVVSVLDVGQQDLQHYIVMEAVAGGDLDDLLAEGRPAPRRAAEIAFGVARALAHAHTKNIIHRDIKPANVLITPDGTVKLTDFGLARDLKRETRLTTPGMALGTPVYMSPEQASGAINDVDELTDVYAVGALLYEMLAGRPPFEGRTSAEIIVKAVNAVPPKPSRFNPQCPRELEWICERAMEKDRRRRYASAGALAADLQAWMDGRPVAARPIGELGRLWRTYRRHPATLVLLGALIGAAILAAWALIAGSG